VSTPLEFISLFREHLREAGIRFAITSGMACIYYELQQNTKDSDWIIPPEDIGKLVKLLLKLGTDLPPWRISYRSLFGAPLDKAYMEHGWSSHISIWERADAPEQHVDIFSRPPRVPSLTLPESGWADRDTVARMKKTDRDKDWPIVSALGFQQILHFDPAGLLHLYNEEEIRNAWRDLPEDKRSRLAEQRPLLKYLGNPHRSLKRDLALEKAIWVNVNRHRYLRFQKAWKTFYRRWQKEQEWSWPSSEPFWIQQRRLTESVQKFGLPEAPIATMEEKWQVVHAGLKDAAAIMNATDEELNSILPPITEMLP
jgi:hypothetical protein